MTLGHKMQRSKYLAFAKPETEDETEVPYIEVVVEDKYQQLQEHHKQRQQRERQLVDQLKASSVV